MAAAKQVYMNIGVFNGDGDFGLWRRRMKAILVQAKLSKALLDPKDLPILMLDDEKKELEEMAFSTISLYLGDKVMREVAMETTTKGLWEKLEGLYMTKSLNQRVHLKTRLYGLRMGEGANLGEFLDSFNSIVLDLSNIGISIEDEDLAIILLSSLPSSYASFVDTLRYSKEKLVLGEVLASLKSKAFYDATSVSRASSELMYVNKGRGVDNERAKRVVTCWYCQKEGHLRRNCPEKKNKGKEKKDQGEASDHDQGISREANTLVLGKEYASELLLVEDQSGGICFDGKSCVGLLKEGYLGDDQGDGHFVLSDHAITDKYVMNGPLGVDNQGGVARLAIDATRLEKFQERRLIGNRNQWDKGPEFGSFVGVLGKSFELGNSSGQGLEVGLMNGMSSSLIEESEMWDDLLDGDDYGGLGATDLELL